MNKTLLIACCLLSLFGCVLGHVTKEIPPPGGCDQCHRWKIAGNWDLALSPVPLGEEGGVPESSDLILREVRRVPFHRDVPGKRLEVFAAAAPPETIGGEETGIQCFVCHRSPNPPHESLRGQIDHPWAEINTAPSGESDPNPTRP